MNPNHTKYVKEIWLTPQGPPQLPQHIQFNHDFQNHQHSVSGVHEEANLPHQPYGWGLEAVCFIGLGPPKHVVDNEVLGFFDAQFMGSREVDIAIYVLKDSGMLADVDHYRGVMLDYKDLLQECQHLEYKLSEWHSHSFNIRKCLVAAKACSHIHPYL